MTMIPILSFTLILVKNFDDGLIFEEDWDEYLVELVLLVEQEGLRVPGHNKDN